jgi:hypothetical protein
MMVETREEVWILSGCGNPRASMTSLGVPGRQTDERLYHLMASQPRSPYLLRGLVSGRNEAIASSLLGQFHDLESPQC